MDVVNELETKLHCSKQDILNAISNEFEEGKSIRVAYQLVLDQKNNLFDGK